LDAIDPASVKLPLAWSTTAFVPCTVTFAPDAMLTVPKLKVATVPDTFPVAIVPLDPESTAVLELRVYEPGLRDRSAIIFLLSY
jgi:hypothetical protein